MAKKWPPPTSKNHRQLNSHATPELGWDNGVIVLTDSTHYPKAKFIEANYEGMSTPELIEVYKSLFHTMMSSNIKSAYGWAVECDYKKIATELKKRGQKVPYE